MTNILLRVGVLVWFSLEIVWASSSIAESLSMSIQTTVIVQPTVSQSPTIAVKKSLSMSIQTTVIVQPTVSQSPTIAVKMPLVSSPVATLPNKTASLSGVLTSSTTLTPAYSSVSMLSVISESLSTSVQTTKTVQPTVSQSPTIAVTKSVGTTRKTASSTVGDGGTKTGVKGKTIGALEIVGFCLLGIVISAVVVFAVYYVAFRKRLYPPILPPTPAVASAEVSAATKAAVGKSEAVPEVGITHAGFTGDPSSFPVPEKVPPVFFNGNAHMEKEGIPGGTPGNVMSNQEGEGTENTGFVEDSAL